jgi:chorismate mutase/prephenate dehydrogenase
MPQGRKKNGEPIDPAVSEQLVGLRDSIAEVDRSLIELLNRRMELAAEVGRVKIRTGQPILVPEVHNRVLTRARQHADACGVSEEVMESIFDAVMRGSVERQHRVGVEIRAEGGSRILILGGAGDMGGWFHNFAHLLGQRVDIVDPSFGPLPRTAGRYGTLGEVDDLEVYDAIIVAVPLVRTGEVLEELIERRPGCQIIEITSIKNELGPVLVRADAAGVKITSLHPMFGPSKSPYESLTFTLAYREDPRLEQERLESTWLRHPYTHLVPIPFDHHDRLMGWLLGFAHLLGMLFGCTLAESGLGSEELWACASTSYTRQASAARHVLAEDPDLYFAIQRLNPHRGDVYEAAQRSLTELVEAVQSNDRERFREILANARKFLVTER